MKLVTKAEAIQLLRNAIALKGEDYVYPVPDNDFGPGCLYVKNGQPDCIVGHALAELGVPVEKMEYRNDDSCREADVISADSIGQNEAKLISAYGLAFTGGAMEVLSVAQVLQDRGESWGFSLEEAIRLTSHLD